MGILIQLSPAVNRAGVARSSRIPAGIADGTGGSYYAAASAEELSSVYRDLGSQIGYTTERREITTWFVGMGLLFAFGAAGVSLLWSNRLL